MVYGDDYETPDGTCIRDYIHILDLAQAHMLALDAPKSGHYNLGTGKGLSVKEIIDTAREVTGHKILAETAPRRLGRSARAHRLLREGQERARWKPRFEDARLIIESVWKWMKSHPDGYKKQG